MKIRRKENDNKGGLNENDATDNKDKWRGLTKAKLGKLLFSEPLLANVQLGGGTSFSNPLNKCCNYLLVCVCGCRRKRLMPSSHTAASEMSLCWGNTSLAQHVSRLMLLEKTPWSELQRANHVVSTVSLVSWKLHSHYYSATANTTCR